MGKTVFFSLIIFLIVWIVSCGPPGSVFQEEEELQVQLETIPRGSFVTAETPIPLSIIPLEEGAYPDKLEILLKDADGQVLSTDIMENEELTVETLPDLYMPSLEPGLYSLELTLFDGDLVIGEETAEFFFVSGTYIIQGISSFPPVIAPSSTALFTVHLDFPEERDPYIVWSVGSTILSAGLYSEEGAELQWEVPETEGVYSIKAEVYPEPPPAGVTFSFNSSQSMSAEVFVTSNISRSDDELGPESSYWTLFHFRGNLKDASEFGSRREAIPNESAEFAVKGGVFGFSLDEKSGFSVPEMLIPIVDESIQPFSLSLRLLMSEGIRGGELLLMESDDKDFSLDLFIGEDGQIGVGLSNASFRTVVDSGAAVLETGTVHVITASFNPVPQGLKVSLYIDGLKTGEMVGSIPDGFKDGSGVTAVGGAPGYSGVLDELGVYYSDASGEAGIDPDVYERGVAEQYGDDLLLAEGFDGLFLPENLLYEGDVEVEGGFLKVPVFGSVELPELEFSYERLITEIELQDTSAMGSVSVSLVGTDGPEEKFTVTFSGDGVLSSGERVAIVSEDTAFRFVLEHNETGVFLVTDDESYLIDPEPGDPSALQIFVENGDAESALLIDRILVYTENPNLVKEKSQSSTEEESAGEPVNV